MHTLPVNCQYDVMKKKILYAYAFGSFKVHMFFVPKALSTINSEEDAEMALQLSSSLTQALLAYRIKTVPTVSSLSLTQSSLNNTIYSLMYSVAYTGQSSE